MIEDLPSDNAATPQKQKLPRRPFRVMIIDPLCATVPYDLKTCEALQDYGLDVTFMYSSVIDAISMPSGIKSTRWKFPNIFLNHNMNYIPARLRTTITYLRYALSLFRLAFFLSRRRFDVVHIQWALFPVADAVFAWIVKRSSVVAHTAHDIVPFNGAPVSSYSVKGRGLGLKLYDKVFVHTNSAKAALIDSGQNPSSVIVIPHGPIINSGEGSKDYIIGERIEFLQFGIIAPYKGVEILLEAIGMLPSAKRRRARFRVVGRSEIDLSDIRNRIGELKIGDCLEIKDEFVDDRKVEELISSANAMLFPYLAIDASGVFSISSRLGIPAIASNIGQFAQDIEHQETGILVPPADATALAQAIEQVIDDPIKLISLRAAASHAARHLPTWANVASLTVAAYADSIDAKSKAKSPAFGLG